ncbi:MAG: serine--tRNA ligase [Candidatus Altiarchaeales archaeon]|nr:MAG: serine--tRNA ligase [Candidatus Altiarchaeales archaeon]
MEFELDCVFLLSSDARGVNFDRILGNLGDILSRGAPDGKGAKIDEFHVDGNRLKIKIKSTRYVRPHEAVFRLRKFLSRELGKHRIGIRRIFAPSYEIKFILEKEPKKSISVPFAHLKFDNKECHIYLENLDEEFLRRNYVDRIIKLINEKIERQYYEGKEEYWELIWQSKPRRHFFDKDPTREMVRRNWIMHRGRGQWIFGPIPTKIMRTMEEIVIDELIKPLNFNEVIIPKAVTWDVWKRSGHAKNLYGEIYYLCPPMKRDPEFWEDVIDMYRITGKVPTDMIKERIREPIGGMTYAQCPPLWPYFQGRTIADESLPIRVFDRSGTSMRYESGGIHGIERVDEFHRIEMVWIGYPEQVRKTHGEIIERYRIIFNKILELEWRMARVTPWFMAQEGIINVEDKEKVIGTIDFEAYLPYRGSREESEWLEFQNASNNGDKYTRGFNVKSQTGEQLHSGCTGVGLERWLAVFLAQKGFDMDNWPKEFLRRLGNLPEGIRFL